MIGPGGRIRRCLQPDPKLLAGMVGAIPEAGETEQDLGGFEMHQCTKVEVILSPSLEIVMMFGN